MWLNVAVWDKHVGGRYAVGVWSLFASKDEKTQSALFRAQQFQCNVTAQHAVTPANLAAELRVANVAPLGAAGVYATRVTDQELVLTYGNQHSQEWNLVVEYDAAARTVSWQATDVPDKGVVPGVRHLEALHQRIAGLCGAQQYQDARYTPPLYETVGDTQVPWFVKPAFQVAIMLTCATALALCFQAYLVAAALVAVAAVTVPMVAVTGAGLAVLLTSQGKQAAAAVAQRARYATTAMQTGVLHKSTRLVWGRVGIAASLPLVAVVLCAAIIVLGWPGGGALKSAGLALLWWNGALSR